MKLPKEKSPQWWRLFHAKSEGLPLRIAVYTRLRESGLSASEAKKTMEKDYGRLPGSAAMCAVDRKFKAQAVAREDPDSFDDAFKEVWQVSHNHTERIAQLERSLLEALGTIETLKKDVALLLEKKTAP